MKLPQEVAGSVRVDTGVREGDVISPYYDPMIAKLIVWGEDRATALAKMSAALAAVNIVGVATNVAFLGRLVKNSAFCEPNLDTGLIPRYEEELLQKDLELDFESLAFLVAAQLAEESKTINSKALEIDSPWHKQDGWRMNGSSRRRFTFVLDNTQRTFDIDLDYANDTLAHDGEGRIFSYTHECENFRIALDNKIFPARVFTESNNPSNLHLFRDGRQQKWHYQNPLAVVHTEEGGAGKLTAPMPGKVVAVKVKAGDRVRVGDPLIVVEAMKMEHTITAPAAGKVISFSFAVGDQVTDGAELVEFEADK